MQAICRVPILLVPTILFSVASHAHTPSPSAHEERMMARRSLPVWATNVVIPQARAFPTRDRATVLITGVDARVRILEQAASTTMDIALRNPTNRRLESELVVPVPDGAVIKGLDFQGPAKEPTAKLLTKKEARSIYDSLVSKIRDPALLEFAGYNLVRTSVFPVEANGTQKVRLTYEQLLTADGDRVDYELPRSESLQYNIPWNISVKLSAKQSVSTIYSPSHLLSVSRKTPHTVYAQVAREAMREPGPFRLSYLLERDGVSASLLAYPDPKVGGGYFLLLAGLPTRPVSKGEEPAIKREVTLVLDRSGSMNGEKIKQAREAALQVIGGLADGEAFNIIAYNEGVDLFSSAPVVKSDKTETAARSFIKGIRPRGGTNIHDALLEALRQKPTKGYLPIVLFLTDGLPTIGQTSEVVIRDLAGKHNPHKRRVFTFGVGVDVNTPLLEKVAEDTRATSTFVLPKEDVEIKVSGVFKRLSGPVLAEPALKVVEASGQPAIGRVRDLIPGKLPDLFEGDQLVLLGQYIGAAPLGFRLNGNYLGKTRAFKFDFKLDKATTRNAFVPRLWASRKIAVLIDAIRQLGANGGPGNTQQATHPPVQNDPRFKELVEEVVRLSKEFGVLTEYTAFLAREGTDLKTFNEVLLQARANFMNRAVNCRVGVGSVSQSFNRNRQIAQDTLNYRNGFFDERLVRVQFTDVQQIGGRTFYRRGGQWVDNSILEKGQKGVPAKKVKYGTKEFEELKERLIKEGRQAELSIGKEVKVRAGEMDFQVSW